jgi:hypothetical protein
MARSLFAQGRVPFAPGVPFPSPYQIPYSPPRDVFLRLAPGVPFGKLSNQSRARAWTLGGLFDLAEVCA